MSDHGCQLTSVAFMQTFAALGIQHGRTSFHNPKGNADVGRVMRTLKEGSLWMREWLCPGEMVEALESRGTDYNEHDLHSALDYKTPRQVEREYHSSHSTQ